MNESKAAVLSARWLETFLVRWNRNAEAKSAFRGVGWVNFVEDAPDGKRTLQVFWDADGIASTGNPEHVSHPTFTAASDTWASFLTGSLDPVHAVLSGRMVYRGPIVFALQYGSSFKHIPLVMQAPESA